MNSLHIGLSVVATDVGGGFSIGLGGLGFAIGLSGSWMLFTGLLGAWLSAVFLIPKVTQLSRKLKFLSFPQFLGHFYNNRVAMLAGIISAIGYIGFTGSQILAGAKLASASFVNVNLNTALLIMGIIAVVYTVMGGLKAVIYTDTIQWAILMIGLIFIGIPLCYIEIGGIEAIKNTLPREFLHLTNLSWQTFINWLITILPIWFIGMTLYQRIYATKNKKVAQRAWFVAGLFEYPVMAFMGVLLGMFAKVAFENNMFESLGYAAQSAIDVEMGLPMLLRTILPTGLLGLMLAAYFSAIMSTADSCLIAASGNILTDILKLHNKKNNLNSSQIITFLIGILALFIALKMPNVLQLMLHSYAFMVSALLIPVLAALFMKKHYSSAAFWSMLTGGSTTLYLIITKAQTPFGLNKNIYGITISGAVFLIIYFIMEKTRKKKM